MEIKIDSDWMIKTDENCIILCRRVKHKKGGTGWRNTGFFTSIEQALNRLCDEAAIYSGATTLEEFIVELEELRKKIVSVCSQKTGGV